MPDDLGITKSDNVQLARSLIIEKHDNIKFINYKKKIYFFSTIFYMFSNFIPSLQYFLSLYHHHSAIFHSLILPHILISRMWVGILLNDKHPLKKLGRFSWLKNMY